MDREESLEDIVKRRNKRLLNFFTVHGLDARIVGDDQKPAVVLNGTYVLSCYVKNFDLHFTKEPFSNEIVRSFKLKNEPEVSKLELLEAIELCSHRPVFKIKLSGTELFLVGYNYLDSENAIGRYPVFAQFMPKVYFDLDYASRLAESLNEENYQVVIV
jgi:hypothetical protein